MNNTYDIAIIGGSIVDTKNLKITIGNIGIKDGTVKIITREYIPAKKSINAKGKIVSPGFIDSHAHIDGHKGNGKLLVLQGVTTAINGHCGEGPYPLRNFFDEMNYNGFIINQVQLTGHTSLREKIGVTDPYIPLTSSQVNEILPMLENEFKSGAAGVSFGLEYVPGASKEEVIRLSEVAAKYDKIVSIHSRDDNWKGLQALEEIIDITKETGSAVVVSHVVYQYGFGMMNEALGIIDKAVKEGYDVACDSGMYTSFGTAIGTNVFKEGCIDKWKCSYSDLVAANGKYAGKRMTKEIYEDLRANYPKDLAIALIGEEKEIYRAFDLPYMMVSSDAGTNKTENISLGHPQDIGTFPRFIKKLVKEQGRLTLVDAIRRCTYLPAAKYKLNKKGNIEVGFDADLVVFDLDRICDKSEFPTKGKSDAPPEGIEVVIINGQVVVEDNVIKDEVSGRAIPIETSKWNLIKEH